jgi:hypothetical protein
MRITPRGFVSRRSDYKRDLRAYRPKSELIARLAEQGVDSSSLERSFFTDFVNLQNRTRGAVFEIVGETLAQTLLGRTETAAAQHCIATPHGGRRIDLFYPALGVALEIKSGFIVCSRSIRMQIQKDEWLLRTGTVSRIVWLLFRGGTQRTRSALDRAGIEWYDIEWDQE